MKEKFKVSQPLKPMLNIDVLRVITDCGRNQLLVVMLYTNSQGMTSMKYIEPYEIKKGHLWAFDTESGKIKQFIMSKISSAQSMDTKFRPRWPIKIS